jgi:hypothetical protein
MTLEGARAYLKENRKKAKDEFDLIENLEKVKGFLYELKRNLSE